MTQVDNLTDFAFQTVKLVLPNGGIATLNIRFDAAIGVPGIEQSGRWVFDISYEGYTAKGLNLCCHPNLLRQWRNKIPFGLACITPDYTDPFTVEDFVNGRASVYLLTEQDVVDVEATLLVNA